MTAATPQDADAAPQVSPEPLPRGLLILLGLAAAVITVAGLRSAAGVIAPSFLAIVLIITVFPIRGWLTQKGWPGWLAAIATIVGVYSILIVMVIALVVSIARLAALVPTYAPQINDLVADAALALEGFGVNEDQIRALLEQLDFGRLFGFATSLLAGILSVLTNLFFIATLVLFIGFDAGRLPAQLTAARAQRPAVVDALRSFAVGTRRYFAVSAVFGFIVAVIDTVALYVIGIPAAIVWGVLAFVTNFIPNIGFVLGVIPPAVLGLLEGGWTTMLVVVVVYSVVNFVIQSIIQPKIVGDALGLSATLTFLSLVFWAWVLGALGALLALPLTLLAKALLVDVDPRSRWLVPLLAGGSEEVPEHTPTPPDEDEEVVE